MFLTHIEFRRAENVANSDLNYSLWPNFTVQKNFLEKRSLIDKIVANFQLKHFYVTLVKNNV